VNNQVKIKIIFYLPDDQTIQVETNRDKAFSLLDSLLERSSTRLTSITETPREEPAPIFTLKVPDRSQLEDFIKSQPDYKFAVEAITQHFFRDELDKHKEEDIDRLVGGIRTKVNRIREAIAKSEKGQWINSYEGKSKVFKFIKDSGGEVKQNQQENDETKQLTIASN